MSGIGKGITCASIAMLLEAKGFRVNTIKIDPYLNVDAGTMNPTEHGEVFVLDSGLETDQDMGNYERFLGRNLSPEDYITSGMVYKQVIEKERALEYKGRCVESLPHIPNEIIRRIDKSAQVSKSDISVIEIGGTVGDYQNIMFIEAARRLHLRSREDVIFVLVSYLPVPSTIGEMKTKPTQNAVHALNSYGVQPDIIIARAPVPLDEKRKEKLATWCTISSEHVISAPDIESIYDVPINFEKDNLSGILLEALRLKSSLKKNGFPKWRNFVSRVKNPKAEVNIAIVGKYFDTGSFVLSDAYISVIEAIKHAGAANRVKPILHWLNAEDVEKRGVEILKEFDGLIVPQGWGSRGAEGKIKTIKYCRENQVPYFGLCYGMQMAVIEFARHVLGFKDANSEEVDPKTAYPVIHIMPGQKELLAKKQYGGTIRLGGWPCKIVAGTHLASAYGKFGKKGTVLERHRHRYEFNNKYRGRFEKAGLKVAGTSPDGKIVEAVEITEHPFFIGTQFHPEYISRPLAPHPLFVEFVRVCGKGK